MQYLAPSIHLGNGGISSHGTGYRMMLAHTTLHLGDIHGDIHGGDGGVPNRRWKKYCAPQYLLFGAGTDLTQPWYCHVTDA